LVVSKAVEFSILPYSRVTNQSVEVLSVSYMRGIGEYNKSTWTLIKGHQFTLPTGTTPQLKYKYNCFEKKKFEDNFLAPKGPPRIFAHEKGVVQGA
jgi:opacity protein-like surface antigen